MHFLFLSRWNSFLIWVCWGIGWHVLSNKLNLKVYGSFRSSVALGSRDVQAACACGRKILLHQLRFVLALMLGLKASAVCPPTLRTRTLCSLWSWLLDCSSQSTLVLVLWVTRPIAHSELLVCLRFHIFQRLCRAFLLCPQLLFLEFSRCLHDQAELLSLRISDFSCQLLTTRLRASLWPRWSRIPSWLLSGTLLMSRLPLRSCSFARMVLDSYSRSEKVSLALETSFRSHCWQSASGWRFAAIPPAVSLFSSEFHLFSCRSSSALSRRWHVLL